MSIMRNLIRWVKITKSGSDADEYATQQITYLGKIAESFIIFPYGLHGNVPSDPESLGLMFSVEGNPDNRVTLGWTPKRRPKLAAGETAFYHPPTDAFIIWKKNGDLDIETGNQGTGNVNINCKQANITSSDSVSITSANEITATTATMNVTATTSVTFDTPVTNFTGAVNVTGLLTWSGGMAGSNAGGGDANITGIDLVIDGISHKFHSHPQGTDSGGNTEQNVGNPI